MCSCPCKPCPEGIVQYEEPTEFVAVDIHAFPLPPLAPPPPRPGVPPHLQRILDKYLPYNWRLDQLSKQVPHKQRCKFTGPPKPTRRKQVVLGPEIEFFADHLSRPPLRTIVENKKLFANMVTKKRRKYFDRIIKRTWGSIYNYYKKKARNKKLRALRSKKSQIMQIEKYKLKKGQKPKEKFDVKRIESLAQPKKVFVPPKKQPKKKKKTWKECPDCAVHLDVLALPSPRENPPTNTIGYVSPAALTYKPTATIYKLATPYERYKNILPPLEAGKVNKNALRYKITQRVDELAVPKRRSEKEVEAAEFDPWAISKNALKYKASPRILELARPMERD